MFIDINEEVLALLAKVKREGEPAGVIGCGLAAIYGLRRTTPGTYDWIAKRMRELGLTSGGYGIPETCDASLAELAYLAGLFDARDRISWTL